MSEEKATSRLESLVVVRIDPENWRSDLFQGIVLASLIFGGLVYIPSVILAFTSGLLSVVVMDTLAIVLVGVLSVRLPVPLIWRVVVFLFVLLGLSGVLMIDVGPIAQIYLVGFSLVATMFISRRAGLIAALISAALIVVLGLLDLLSDNIVPGADAGTLWGPLLVAANFSVVNVVLVIALGGVIQTLERSVSHLRATNEALSHERAELVRTNEALQREVNERQRAQQEHAALDAQLQRSRQLDALGRFAGGIAHDFNNLLSVIIGSATLARMRETSEKERRQALDNIIDTGQRSARLVRRLMTFARKQPTKPVAFDPNATLKALLDMLARLSGERIKVRFGPGSRIDPIYMDPAQFDQIMVNLVANARDAIQGQGRIDISTSISVFLDEAEAKRRGLKIGRFVQIQVTDTGTGIDEKTRERLFEPYFTTKPTGQGSGIGLPTVYGIVTQNGGAILVESTVGEGTTFTILLPARPDLFEEVVDDPRTEPTPFSPHDFRPHPKSPTPASSGRLERPDPSKSRSAPLTILLVDDEAPLLKLTARVLRGAGYRVFHAAQPEQAMTIANAFEGKIDLLITDVMMPGMNGREVYRRLSASRPDLRCLFVSGYTNNIVSGYDDERGETFFLSKPFTPEELTDKLHGIFKGKKR
ncbi:MAG: response regulator [Deltaproteobacteria bacterium]|nr:MAG: response regulator [Deltaproteobacteria bacterium]